MKHVIEARQATVRALRDPAVAKGARELCVIVDMEGRLRLLARLEDSQPEAEFKQRLDQRLKKEAESFWTGEVLLDKGKSHQDGESSREDRKFFDAVWNCAEEIHPGPPALKLVQRRVSKHLWFEPGIQPPWPLRRELPKIASFYSFKGGVGRSTILASFAIQLARRGKRVAVLDFDLEAPGQGSIFPAPDGTQPRIGLLDYFVEYPVLKNELNVEDLIYAFDDKTVIGDGAPIQVAQAGLVDEHFVEKLALLNTQRLTANTDGRLSDDVNALLNGIRAQCNPDWILIDSRAGLHDLGGLALSGLAHWHVLCGIDSDQSWRGLAAAIACLGRLEIAAGQPQRDCLLIQCLTPPPPNAALSTRKFAARAYEVFSQHYYASPDQEIGDVEYWTLPDQEEPMQPHSPSVIGHDLQVMGYDSITSIPDRLCSGDFASAFSRFQTSIMESAPS